MKVKLPIIWSEKQELNEEEEISLRALGKDPEIVENEGSVVIETTNVASWYEDKESTVLILSCGKAFRVDMDEAAFSMLWVELTSEVIKNIEYSKLNTEEDVDN